MRLTLRQLRKSPGFSALAVLIVALGIGASTAIFSVVNTLVLHPVALPEPDRLVAVYETHLERNLPDFAVSLPNYIDWRDRTESFASLAAMNWRAMNLTGRGEPELIPAKRVSANFLPTFGIPIQHGRNFFPEETEAGAAGVAIITDAFWRRRLDADPDILGQSLSLDGGTYTIVGVTAPGSPLPDEIEIAIPLVPNPEDGELDRLNHELAVYGRLKPGVTLDQADAELKTLAAQTWQEHPLETGWSTQLMPFAREIVGDGVRHGVLVLFGAVLVLLLIACANLSNLLLVRFVGRTHEIAIRTALGASRWRLIRQQLAESLLVTGVGGMLGLLLATWTLELVHSIPLPRAQDIVLDLPVVAAACSLTLLTGLFAGAGPAWAASQTRPQHALKDRAPLAGSRSRFRDGLVVAQVALSLTLLVGAALLIRSFWQLLRVDPGFNAEHVLTFAVRPTANAAAFYDELQTRVSALPGVASVGSINRLPLTEGDLSNNMRAVGPSRLAPDQSVQASWRLVHGDYFATMQIPLLRGSTFDGLPPWTAARSAIISSSFARTLWGDDDPIGRKIERANDVFTVVGVVGDVRSQQLGIAPTPAFYMSAHRFVYGPQSLVLRLAPNSQGASADAAVAPLIASVRAILQEIDPTVPMFRIRMMDAVRAHSVERERLLILLLSVFALVAWFLAAVGTYGVIAHTVQQRTREIGVRVAVGAQSRDILHLVIGQGLRLTITGVVLGLAFSFAGAHTLASLLYNTRVTDTLSYALATTALVGAALAASLIPARRATKVDPLIALRSE